jgi:hypothetical protein
MSFARHDPSHPLVSSQSFTVEMTRIPIVFLIVNPTSGGNRASEFVKLGLEFASFVFDNKLKTDLYIYDIRDGESGKKKGFEHLKFVVESSPWITSERPVRLKTTHSF